jgi:enolase
MTPTAALADIVLPAAWGMEHEELGYWPGWYEEIRAYPKLVDPPGEAWADTKWLNELAKRLGVGEHFWKSDEEALDVVDRAVEKVTKELGFRIGLGLDMAASGLWDAKRKVYDYSRKGRRLTTAEQISYVLDLIHQHSLFYVEDPLDEEDFDGFMELTAKANGARIVGDDIFVTQLARLRRGISINAGNGVIMKVNQVGPLYDAVMFAREAHGAGYLVAASHRSGDTWEPHLAQIAIGAGAELIKCGVLGGERMAKLAELIRLSEQHPALTLARL